jgi:fructose-specific phosphotransferase system IIA component
MRIIDLLDERAIDLELKSMTKADVIRELAGLLEKAEKLNSIEDFLEAVFEREKHSTTGIGYSIAIPHGKSRGVKHPAIAFGRSLEGIDFDSLDGKKAKLFFMIGVPEESHNEHLKVLSRLSRMLIHDDVRTELMKADSKKQVMEVIRKRDS